MAKARVQRNSAGSSEDRLPDAVPPTQPLFPNDLILDALTGEATGFERLAPGTYIMSGPRMRIHIDVGEDGARLRLVTYRAHDGRLVQQRPHRFHLIRLRAVEPSDTDSYRRGWKLLFAEEPDSSTGDPE